MTARPMLEIVQLPLARRLWRVCKLFNLPLSDERIQNMDVFDLEFYEYSTIADDPKKLEQLKNHYYDPEFEEWLEEFEQDQKGSKPIKVDLPDNDTISWSKRNREHSLDEDYEEVTDQHTEISDWEKVEE